MSIAEAARLEAGQEGSPDGSAPSAAGGVRRRMAEDLRTMEGLVVTGAGGRRILRLLVPGSCRHACPECPMADQSFLSPPGNPERVARLAVLAFRRGLCDGIFLSCGLPLDPVAAAERQLRLVRYLRIRLGFRGYLHAKVPPGAGEQQVAGLLHLVDRLSREPEGICRSASAPPIQGLSGPAWRPVRPAPSRGRGWQLPLWSPLGEARHRGASSRLTELAKVEARPRRSGGEAASEAGARTAPRPGADSTGRLRSV